MDGSIRPKEIMLETWAHSKAGVEVGAGEQSLKAGREISWK